VEFAAGMIDPGARVPKGLFDGVADNLLQNAIAKRAQGGSVRVRVGLDCGRGPELRVCDSGRAMAADVAAAVLRAPVRSDSGLGIGLYQSAKHAEECGYALTLAENRDGEVCFLLSPAAG
jgi:signal transduction histidine kinase